MVLVKAISLSLLSVFTLMPGLLVLFCPLIDKTRHKKLLPDVSFLGKFAVKSRRILPPYYIKWMRYVNDFCAKSKYLYPGKIDINDLLGGRVGVVALLQLRIGAYRLVKRDVELKGHHLGDLVHLVIGNAEHAPHIADRAARRHSAEGDDLRHAVVSVLFDHIIDAVAEAALYVSGVFNASQQAVDYYMDAARKKADVILEDARNQAASMLADAEEKSRCLANMGIQQEV